jgi:hypothetical protein
MRLLRIVHYYMCFLVLVSLSVPALVAQVSVLTQHNDNSRTGQNLQETILNTSTVNVANFGELFSLPVTGNIFAQPLYVPGLTISGATHNVVYVATAENYVYAFDADSGNTNPLWVLGQNALGTPVPSQDICVTDPVECPYTDVIPVIGILATPVIDPVSGTIYVVANSKDNSGGYHFKLHALDLTSGAEKFGGPTEITATGLNQLTELCRPGLLLANGTVYLAMGSVGDFPTWHGFVIGYNASTLQQVAVYNSTPQSNDVGGAGIWQTGNGLVADANGDIYAVTSNGNFDVNTGGKDYGSAYLKLSGSTLSVLDYFVPYNQASMNPEEDNVDLGSGGPLLIPNTTLLVGGGKDAVLRVVDTTNMGEYSPAQNNNHQNLIGATNPPIFGSPVYWNSPNLGPLIYMWGQDDFAKAWSYNAGTNLLSTTPAMESSVKGTNGWNDQAALSISANGSASGTGILWASMPYSGISNPGPVPGILYALDATNLNTMLWSSQLDAGRDAVGNYAKFVPPTVANGKVYLATFSGELVVYGLIAPPGFSVTASPSSQSVMAGGSASYIVYVTPQGGFSGTVTLTCSGLPSGASCSPASISVPSGSSGQVSGPLTINTTAGGSSTFTITATSGSVVQTTTASLTVTGFALTATALSPASITPGGSATSTVTVAPSGGFNSNVSLTCAITPATATSPRCSLSAGTVGGANGTSMLTVSTVASGASLRANRLGSMYYAMLLPLCGLTLLGAGFRSRSRKPLRWLAVCMMLSCLVWLAACGSGSSGGGGGSGGTTAGSYTVTVTGTAGTLTQTQTLAVTVN